MSDTISNGKKEISESMLARHWEALEAIRNALTRGVREEAAIGLTHGQVALGYSGGPG